MKRYFIASLCKNGILGGGITADEEGLTYYTNKVSVTDNLKKIEMKKAEILDMTKGWLLCFPTVTVHMRDGSAYRFVVFRRNLFCACGGRGDPQ